MKARKFMQNEYNSPFKIYPAGSGPSPLGFSRFNNSPWKSSGPLVSCLMVTRGKMDLVRNSYTSFQDQNYINKELIIVCDAVSEELMELAKNDNRVLLVNAPQGLKLGDLRNLSVSKSRGEFVCQWDDDDLFDPARISMCVNILIESSASALFLNRWLMHWSQKDIFCISGYRVWEGSMMAKRSVIPVYPSLVKSEDSILVDWIIKNHTIVLLDCPHLYLYRVTGSNTWDENHFNKLFDAATKKYTQDEVDELRKLPCLKYLK